MRTILLPAAALAVLTGCQSAVEKQRLEADSGDLSNCARIRVVSSGCGRNSGFTKVYVDNMHKDHAVRATVRKHSQEGDDDTEYAIAEGGQLLVCCGGGGTSFAVVGCKVLTGEAEKRNGYQCRYSEQHEKNDRNDQEIGTDQIKEIGDQRNHLTRIRL